MPSINITTISDGSVASASQVNTPLNTIVNAINGNLDSDNLAANAVTTAKIADSAVTSEKITSTISFMARRTTDQANIVTGTATKIQFATEDHDTGSDYDNATNYRFTAPVKGVYHFDAQVCIDASGGELWCMIYVNGSSSAKDVRFSGTATNDNSTGVSLTKQLNANDYVEVYALHNAGANRSLLGTQVDMNYFSGFLVGRVA
jgi:hypothetical protein